MGLNSSSSAFNFGNLGSSSSEALRVIAVGVGVAVAVNSRVEQSDTSSSEGGFGAIPSARRTSGRELSGE